MSLPGTPNRATNKNDATGWKQLQESWEDRQQTVRDKNEQTQTRRRHQIEQHIHGLQSRPSHPDRNRRIKTLQKQLDDFGRRFEQFLQPTRLPASQADTDVIWNGRNALTPVQQTPVSVVIHLGKGEHIYVIKQ